MMYRNVEPADIRVAVVRIRSYDEEASRVSLFGVRALQLADIRQVGI
jgi:hypothetical protein